MAIKRDAWYTRAMIDALTIYIDRLREGVEAPLEAVVSVNAIDLGDADTTLIQDVHVHGVAYVADQHLIVRLSLETAFEKPCKICNEKVPLHLKASDMYWMRELGEISGAIVDGNTIVREFLIAEMPSFVECNNGNCLQREEVEKFSHHRLNYRPFEDL